MRACRSTIEPGLARPRAGLDGEPDLACLALEKRIPVAAGLGGGRRTRPRGGSGAHRAACTAPPSDEELVALARSAPTSRSSRPGLPAARVGGIGERSSPASRPAPCPCSYIRLRAADGGGLRRAPVRASGDGGERPAPGGAPARPELDDVRLVAAARGLAAAHGFGSDDLHHGPTTPSVRPRSPPSIENGGARAPPSPGPGGIRPASNHRRGGSWMPDREVITSDAAPPPRARTARRSAPATSCSPPGQLGIDPVTGELAAGDVAGQAERAREPVGRSSTAAGSGPGSAREGHRLPRRHRRLAGGERGLRARDRPRAVPARSAFAVNGSAEGRAGRDRGGRHRRGRLTLRIGRLYHRATCHR